MVAPILCFRSRISAATSPATEVAAIDWVPCFFGGGGTTHARSLILSLEGVGRLVDSSIRAVALGGFRPDRYARANVGPRPRAERANGGTGSATSGRVRQPVQQPGADGRPRPAGNDRRRVRRAEPD